MYVYDDYRAAAEEIKRRAPGAAPEVLVVLGSGLGFLADAAEESRAVDYADIPGFGRSTAPGHRGRLVLGTLGGRRAALMQGRVHGYEGYTMEQIAFPVRVARGLGAETLVLTNAAGAVNRAFAVGDIMLIRDHIKLAAESPLRGPNLGEFGPRFCDMTETYTPSLREKARDAAAALPLREGVYMYFAGPQYETPAEIRAAATLGADAVGMSSVPEAIAARHCGMAVAGFSLVTNMAAGILDRPLDGDEVIAAAEAAKERFSALVLGLLARL